MISKADMEKLTDAMAIAMVDFVKPKFQHLEQRIAALEAKQPKGAKPVVRLPARTQRWAA